MSKRYWAENSQIADMKIAEMVERVFMRMMEFHTEDKRNKAIGLSDLVTLEVAMKSWAREFALMTPDMVIRGGRKVKEQKFCPNLAQFLQLCKPNAEEAYVEAQAGMAARSRGEFGFWTCPAVYNTAIEFGSMDLKIVDWYKAQVRFTKIFERMIERQERGELESIPEPVPVDMRLENEPVTAKDSVKVEAFVQRAFAAIKAKPYQSWSYKPRSLKAVTEMLNRAKSGHLDKSVLQANVESGVLVVDGDWYKPVGYFDRDRLVLLT